MTSKDLKNLIKGFKDYPGVPSTKKNPEKKQKSNNELLPPPKKVNHFFIKL